MTAPTRLRILLVDRQPSNQTNLQRQLGAHELYLAQDYDRAGDILRRKSLDVVVVDHQPEVLRLAARLQPEARRFLHDHSPPENLSELLAQGVLHRFLPRAQQGALVAQIQALAGSGPEPFTSDGVQEPSRGKPEPGSPSSEPDHPPRAAAKDTGQPSAEEQQLLQRLQDELLALQEKSDHVVLGLPSSANAAEARTAFFTLSKHYHPDLFARHADPRIGRTATEIFVLIKSAYTRLSRSKRRSIPATPTPPVHPAPPAGDPALEAVREHVAAGRLTVARALLEQMLSGRPDHAEATIWLRLVQARELEQAGDHDQAMARYQEVLALDDQNAAAIQSLRVLFDRRRGRS